MFSLKKHGSDNTITIEIANNEKVGVIEGVISHDAGIKQIEISSNYNGWIAIYNEETGKFNALKPEGTNKEEVLQITYQLDQQALQGTITVEDIELTTISYNTIDVGNNISKTIKKENKNANESNSGGSSSKVSGTNGETRGNRTSSSKQRNPKARWTVLVEYCNYSNCSCSFNCIIQKSERL